MTLLRLNGGVVALEKIKLIDGVRIPVAHDDAAHKAFLTSTRSSLSPGQKFVIANHHEYPPSDAQLQDLKHFKHTI